MQYEEFVEQVRSRAGFESTDQAEEGARATLTVLGEYLSGGEGRDLAAQLPQGLAEHLVRQPPDRSEIFSYNDFVQRIAEEENTSIEEAEDHTRAVMGVLHEAVSEGEIRNLRRQFPSEFDPLFE